MLMGLPFGTQVDVWSLGCTLCELYTGTPLFDCPTPKVLHACISSSKLLQDVICEMIMTLGPMPRALYQRGTPIHHIPCSQ